MIIRVIPSITFFSFLNNARKGTLKTTYLFLQTGRKSVEEILPKYYNQSMIYTWNEIVKKEGNRNLANQSVANRKYIKVSHGIYVDDGQYISELEQLFVKYPRATLTLQSAFSYYNLTDNIPDKYHLVTPSNSHLIANPKVTQTYMNENIIDIGREKLATKYGYIYIYNKERMLIELFRHKTKLPINYFLEVVSSYRVLKSMEVISFRKVSEYCQKITYGDGILKEIQETI